MPGDRGGALEEARSDRLYSRHVSSKRFARDGIAFLLTVGILVVAPTSRALGQQGPAMNSFYMNVKPTDGECCANLTFAMNLPPGRKNPPPALTMERVSLGRYVILAEGAAPFPTPSPRGGFFVAVTAISSNAHCFEDSTLVRGFRDLVGVVRCVDPKGSPIDSQFSWSYRADSLDFAQLTDMPKNFAYAQVFPDGKMGTHFTPVDGGAITALRVGPGAFRVKITGLKMSSAAIDPKSGAGVLVSNVCPKAPCETNVCVPARWSQASNTSTIDIDCSDRTGKAIDNGFRVFLGQEGLNSQSLGKFKDESDYKKQGQHYNEGTNYGWVNSFDMRPSSGIAPVSDPKIVFVNKSKDHPGPRKIEYAHPALGRYIVRFKDQLIYGQTYWSMHATARETDRGTYCNIGDIDYHNAEIGVNCFDGTGASRDAKWFMAMRRLYN